MEPNDEPRDQIDANLFYMSTEISKLCKVNAELLKALQFAESALFYIKPHMLECGRMWDTAALLAAIDQARAAIRAAKGENNA